MNCEDVLRLLPEYHDGELKADQIAEVDEHLGSCPTCAAELGRLQALSAAIREKAPYYTAPEALSISARRTIAPAQTAWRLIGAGFAIGVAAMLPILLWISVKRGNSLTGELVANHVRSLMANHLIDVESTDRHTVKPWFLGKVDVAPTVVDLAKAGFPLVGGRLDYVDGHTVAALVYRRNLHTINVFVMHEVAGSDDAGGRDGYRVVHWREGDLGYYAVADVSQAELDTFAQEFQRTAR